VTISGARTGTVGGAVPYGGIVLSLERLNKIKSISRETMTAVVEPGVILSDFQKAVEAEGLFYPPDPTEWSCQIGGTVATNASGARSFKYGATREFVKRLKIILADGDLLAIERGDSFADESGRLTLSSASGREIVVTLPTYERPDVRKNVSGYFCTPGMDAIDLFIGSEGTLGAITEVELSLDSKPEGFFSGIVFFERNENLLSFVEEVRQTSFDNRRRLNRGFEDFGYSDPTTPGCAVLTDVDARSSKVFDASLVEYFDDRALSFISEKFPETPAGMAGAIFFEQETTPGNEDRLLEQWNRLLEKHAADLEKSWFTTAERDREKMRGFRHALPVAVNERVVRNKQKKIGTDMAVPDANFSGFLHFYKQWLDANGLDYVIFGHIGDCHLHANLLPKNDVEAEHARHLYGRFIAQAMMLGGTVSAEHGIGKLKSKYLHVMMGERYLNEMAEVKRVFDPKGILGRGNMIAERFL
ncbi:MAG: FAD-binding oxidoreductase, partial [Acidobacteria bacterium]|nr:FAD-binding oxidoreductase [Acidobacteriota bacterium]